MEWESRPTSLFYTAPELCDCTLLLLLLLLKCCFMSTETVGLLRTGAQDVHLDFHTAPGLRQCACALRSGFLSGTLSLTDPQTPSTGLRLPSSNHYTGLRHRSRKKDLSANGLFSFGWTPKGWPRSLEWGDGRALVVPMAVSLKQTSQTVSAVCSGTNCL